MSRGDDVQGWRALSVCRQHPTRWWFAGDQREAALAKSICSGCDVQRPCLEFALARPDVLGIWAATTASERASVRRRRREPGASPVAAIRAESAPQSASAAPSARTPTEMPGPAETCALPPAPQPRGSARARRVARPRFAPESAPGEISALLTPAEAARKLGVTPNTVTRWSRAGKLSSLQTMGGHRRFRLSEIERVLRDGGLPAPAPV